VLGVLLLLLLLLLLFFAHASAASYNRKLVSSCSRAGRYGHS
jgi:hypothetical protein